MLSERGNELGTVPGPVPPRLSRSPLISFIVPVYNVARYLTKCLDSLTNQEFADFEIIAVDGGSDDGSAAILDMRARAEPRLTVFHEGRIGPGNARNLGAQHAKGEYLWFVDGDDVITADCLRVISGRLTSVAPDVLVGGYEAERQISEPLFRPWSAAPSLERPECFTLAEQPAVLDRTVAAWNKLVRREYFFALDLSYPAEWPHEDVAVSCRLLLWARSLYVLDHVCYRYHVGRPGSAMKAGGPARHFLVFGAWQSVLKETRSRAAAGDPLVTADVYHALFGRAIRHCSNVLEMGGFGIGRLGTSGYVARRDRREFFAMMHATYVAYAPPGYRAGRGFRAIKFSLIKNDWYALYSVLDPLNKIRNSLRWGVRVRRSG